MLPTKKNKICEIKSGNKSCNSSARAQGENTRTIFEHLRTNSYENYRAKPECDTSIVQEQKSPIKTKTQLFALQLFLLLNKVTICYEFCVV